MFMRLSFNFLIGQESTLFAGADSLKDGRFLPVPINWYISNLHYIICTFTWLPLCFCLHCNILLESLHTTCFNMHYNKRSDINWGIFERRNSRMQNKKHSML